MQREWIGARRRKIWRHGKRRLVVWEETLQRLTEERTQMGWLRVGIGTDAVDDALVVASSDDLTQDGCEERWDANSAVLIRPCDAIACHLPHPFSLLHPALVVHRRSNLVLTNLGKHNQKAIRIPHTSQRSARSPLEIKYGPVTAGKQCERELHAREQSSDITAEAGAMC
jgi:hypothetical protein